MVRELDPAVGARARAVVCGVLLVFTFGMTRVILRRIDAGQPTVPRDLSILAGLCVLAGFWLFRWLFLGAAVLAGAAIWAALDPSLAYLLFSVAPPLMFAGFLLGWDTARSSA